MPRSTRPARRHADDRAALDLTAPERDRILAKSALFDPPPIQLADGRRELVGLSRAELADEMAAIGERRSAPSSSGTGSTIAARPTSPACPRSRARCSKSWRNTSSSAVPRPRWCRPATDETRKFLFRFRDGQEAETVYIPDRPGGPRRGLHLLPGRLHAVLPLLPHRHAAPDAQPGSGGDRRPVHGGARCLQRMAQPDRRNPSAALHHRADGHGRTALQLRQRRQGDDDRDGQRRHRAVTPAHHAVHLGRRADDGPRGRGTRRQPRSVAACRAR